MGNCCTRIGGMMAGRNSEPQVSQQSTYLGVPLLPNSRGDPARSPMHPHRGDDLRIVVGDSSRPVVTTNDLTEKQEVPEERQGSPELISKICTWLTSMFTNNSKKETELKLDRALKEIDELRSRLLAQDDHIRNLESDLDRVSRNNQEIQACCAASDKKVQELKLIIEEKVKDLETEKVHTSQLEAKCLKLEADLALVEKQAAQESLTSGSYSDDHANPGMLVGACKAADKATEALARFLHNNSVTKDLSVKSPELEQFIRHISPAHPAEFSRPIQVKYVWAHWICHQMFQGFEHVFFDVDGGQRTSPLDYKKHALECFQGFQQKQSVVSSDLFQAFCSRKSESVFPPWLVHQALSPPGIIFCDENGRLQGDGELHALFMDVAEAVWLLHKLAFSFDPPASILRMARGAPYDEQFHESVIHVEDNRGTSSQMAMVSLMIRPAFRVRKSITRSRVFLCNIPNNSPTKA